MLRPELADKVRPFSRRREAHAAAALAIGEAERGNNLHRSVLTHAVGERLQSIIKTAAVRLLAFGNGRSTAAPASEASACGLVTMPLDERVAGRPALNSIMMVS